MTAPSIPIRLLNRLDRIELPSGLTADVTSVYLRRVGDFLIVDYDDITPISSVLVCYIDEASKVGEIDAAPDFEVGFLRSAAEAVAAS